MSKKVEISKKDLLTLVEGVSILKMLIGRQDDNADAYNMICDGGLDSPTWDEEGYYTDEEKAIMENHIDEYVDKWRKVIKKNWEKTI
jgi:hypothetical protein